MNTCKFILKYKSDFIKTIIFFSLSAFVVVVLADTASTSVAVGNAAPEITALTVYNGNLTLTENTFKWATSSMTVTDANGCSEITGVTATFYLASTTNDGTLCTYDGNNCYTSTCIASTTATKTCEGGSDTTVTYECGFDVWYTAISTDGSSEWNSSIWSVSATTTDGTATVSATNTLQTIEIGTLLSLDVTSSITFDATSPGTNTGASNETATVTNTGNIAQDLEVSGTDSCLAGVCDDGYFGADEQQFALAPFTYDSDHLGALNATTSGAVSIATVLAKPTSTSSPVTDDTYWGIAVPVGQTTGSYTGTDTFTAITDTND